MAHSAANAGAEKRPRKLPAPARRALPASDPEKRRRLLHAAIQTFGRRGFHEAKIADIASEAGVAEGTVYLYFRNKEDLLGCVFDETMDEVLTEAREIRSGPGTAAEKLTALVGRHLSFVGQDRDLASVFQIELRRSARLVERFSRSKLSEYFRLLDGVLREGIASGELRKELEPKIAARILFGAADEILSEWLLSGEPKPAADAEKLVGTLLRGFLACPNDSMDRRAPRRRRTTT
jgi:TetR/AcrR family fatty acid metabolism transcriptional regulator